MQLYNKLDTGSLAFAKTIKHFTVCLTLKLEGRLFGVQTQCKVGAVMHRKATTTLMSECLT